jgi:hypothetical protein
MQRMDTAQMCIKTEYIVTYTYRGGLARLFFYFFKFFFSAPRGVGGFDDEVKRE